MDSDQDDPHVGAGAAAAAAPQVRPPNAVCSFVGCAVRLTLERDGALCRACVIHCLSDACPAPYHAAAVAVFAAAQLPVADADLAPGPGLAPLDPPAAPPLGGPHLPVPPPPAAPPLLVDPPPRAPAPDLAAPPAGNEDGEVLIPVLGMALSPEARLAASLSAWQASHCDSHATTSAAFNTLNRLSFGPSTAILEACLRRSPGTLNLATTFRMTDEAMGALTSVTLRSLLCELGASIKNIIFGLLFREKADHTYRLVVKDAIAVVSAGIHVWSTWEATALPLPDGDILPEHIASPDQRLWWPLAWLFLGAVNRVQLFHHLIRTKTDRLIALTSRDFQPPAVWAVADRHRRDLAERSGIIGQVNTRALHLLSSRSSFASTGRRPFVDRTNSAGRQAADVHNQGPPRQVRRLHDGAAPGRTPDNPSAGRFGRGGSGGPSRGGGRGRRGGRDGSANVPPAFRPYQGTTGDGHT
jgi:hypothetical protein